MPELIFMLVVTFLALGTAYFFYSDTPGGIHVSVLKIVVVFLENAVVPIFFELHLGFPVTVDTPAHAQICKLIHLPHFVYFPMAGLALYLTHFYVLGVVEVYVIRQVMNLYPFYGTGLAGIPWFAGLKSGILEQLLNFPGAVYFIPVSIV